MRGKGIATTLPRRRTTSSFSAALNNFALLEASLANLRESQTSPAQSLCGEFLVRSTT